MKLGIGSPLTPADYAELERSYITREVAEAAGLFRVTTTEGREIVGQNNGYEDYAGIVFPYYWPGDPGCRAHRLRRDNPPIVVKNGVNKEDKKYLSAARWGNQLYFVPLTPESVLSDVSVPIVIAEGQKKCLALWRLGHEASPNPEPLFIPIGLNGVWGYRGRTGIATNSKGRRVPLKGIVPDFGNVTWKGRRVYILFDTNVHSNELVGAARKGLAQELETVGAIVRLVDLPPEDGINGIDDFLGKHGPVAALKLIESAHVYSSAKEDTNVRELADEITETDHFARDAGGRLYVFEGGVYRSGGAPFIRARVKQLYLDWRLGHAWSSRKANEVIEYISVDVPELWEKPPLDVVNVANGLLNVRTKVLEPHSPDHLSPIQIPVAYDADARCPAWDEFIGQVFPDDSEAVAWQIPAWLMTPDMSIQKAVLLTGEGSNGKSTYLRACVAFIGKPNTSAISLHKIEQDKFAAVRLLGKLANICPDLASAHLTSTSMFKALTGGDLISSEYKFVDSFEFVPYAKLVFSANQPPRSDDSSHGFFRRWQVIPFRRTFEGDAIPREVLDARLGAPEELSGVLNKALDALSEIRKRGDFGRSESMDSAWDEFRQATDPVSVWLDGNTVEDPEAVASKQEVLKAYNAAALAAGRPTMTNTALGLAIRRAKKGLQDKQRTVNNRLQWCYLGFRMKTEGE